MVRAWKVVLIIGIIIFISIIAALEAGVALTPYYFLPFILIFVIFVILWLIYKVAIKKEAPTIIGKAKLSIASVKFIAAMHLLNHHGIDLFATGFPSDPRSARYVTNIIANRCFPSPGEEAWFVRLTMRDKRYFDGIFTRIIVYVDGEANVTDDFIMNEMTFIDGDLWRHPESWFVKRPSKTAKPRTLQQILAQRFEETGEMPSGITVKPHKKEE